MDMFGSSRKARKDLAPYLFISWLDPFLATRARETKRTNVLSYKKRTMLAEGDSSENEENNDHEESADEI